MKIKLVAAASAVVLAFAGAALAQTAPPAAGSAVPVAKRYGTWGYDLSARNASVRPGDSFFEYANGAWYAKAVIPADQASASVGQEVFNLSQSQLRAVIEDSARNPGNASAKKIGDLYNAFMDEAAVEAAGDASLKADLVQIAAIQDRSAMAEHMGRTNAGFGGAVFGAYIDPEQKDPTNYAFNLVQGGLGLPDRDYYTKDNFKAQREAYHAYIARALTMAGWPNAAKHADDVMAMEIRIADASWARADRRDADKTYNPMTVAELSAYAPGFDWNAYMRGSGAAHVTKVVVAEKSAFPKIAAIYSATPLETLKAWEAFQTIDQASPYLPKRYVDSRFAYRGTALQGLQENRPRWKRAVTLVDASLGEAVGQQYVAKYFPPRAKAEMETLVGNLKVAMRKRIEALDWMSPQTKSEALRKLEKMRVRVGYPHNWRAYDALAIDKDLYRNVQRSNAFEWAHNTGKLGKPVDQEEWYLTPQTVNAYSDGTRNVIVFPAAILQPPYFDLNADPAVNYGAIGGVIGHEISHGFDDQGRKTDADSKLRDWWTKEDAARFEAQAAKLGAQFDAYEVEPGLHVNGKLTMGENIGDLAGLVIALDAYRASLNGKPAPVIEGLTGEQRVYLGWAQNWQAKQRPDAVKQQVASDPHSPARFRAEGNMRNIDDWYAAWDVKATDKMYLKPEDRARIW